MSRVFGPIRQNGYLVADLDQALDHWINRLGIGPFFRRDITFDYYRHHGVESRPELSIAVANSGDLQIELIQQTNDAPSQYREWIEANGPGLQHVSVWSEQFDQDIARFAQLGHKLLVEAKLADGGRAMFYDTELHGGTCMEVFDLQPPVKAKLAQVRLAAVDWDGRDPIRPLAA